MLFGLTVASVLSDPTWTQVAQDLDVVELWSGVGAVFSYARSVGLHAEEMDIRNGPHNDLTTEGGFHMAVSLVMRLKPGGLLVEAPDCSSWTFPASSTHQRTKNNIEGNTNNAWVCAGTLMARIAGFLMCLCTVRGVECLLENPSGSQIFAFLKPCMDLIPSLVTVFTDRCAFVDPALRTTENYYKHFKLKCTGRWITEAVRKCTCPEGSHSPLMDIGDQGQKNGRPQDLRTSGSYPAAMGAAIVEAWRNQGPGLGLSAVEQHAHLAQDEYASWGSGESQTSRTTGKTAFTATANATQSEFDAWSSPTNASGLMQLPTPARNQNLPDIATWESVDWAASSSSSSSSSISQVEQRKSRKLQAEAAAPDAEFNLWA